MTVPTNIRQELIRLSSKATTRRSQFTQGAPTKWKPSDAQDPNTGQPYTLDAAWDRVHSELANGCGLSLVNLDKPPGKKGYTFHFVDAAGRRIYVKLQIGSGFVIGRSFHIG